MAGQQIALLTAAMLLGSGLVATGAARARDNTVMVDLHLRLVDARMTPLAGVPLRLRIGSAIDRHMGGVPATTDASGTVQATVRVALANRSRTLPTHFVTGLFASARPTRHLQVGVELQPFSGGPDSPWLWALDVDRFADGTLVSTDEFKVWTSQPDGRFERPLHWRGPAEGAELPDGRRLATLPWRPAELRFSPLLAEEGPWRLSLVVMRRS
jgi:hypothetical protein